MKVEFTTIALAQIELIRGHVAAHNPAAAVRVVDRIYAASRRLEAHPWSGHRTRPRVPRHFRLPVSLRLELHGRERHRNHPARSPYVASPLGQYEMTSASPQSEP